MKVLGDIALVAGMLAFLGAFLSLLLMADHWGD